METSNFTFPDSPQAQLFSLLKEEQREFLKPILRVVKHGYQSMLCTALLDYLQTGIPDPPYNHQMGILFHLIIERAEIRPLSNPIIF